MTHAKYFQTACPACWQEPITAEKTSPLAPVSCTALVGAEAREKELWDAFLRIEKEAGEKIDALRTQVHDASEAWGKAYAEANRLRRLSAPTGSSQLPRPWPRSDGPKDSETNLNPDDTAGRG